MLTPTAAPLTIRDQIDPSILTSKLPGVSSPQLGVHAHAVQFTRSRGPAEHRVRVHERPLAPRHAAEAFVAARVRFLGGCARSGMPLRGRGARFEMLRSEAYLGRWFSPLTTQTAGSVSAVLQRKPEWLHASASAALAPLRPVPLSRNFGPHVRCAREPWERTAKRQI